MATVRIMAALLPLAGAAACKAPPAEPETMVPGDPARGRIAIAEAGCGACHVIPGVWPKGEVGPALGTFGRQALIAGRLPNRPDLLAAFLRDAPRWVPGTAMPATTLTEEDARHAAAYLYSLGDR